MRESKSARFCRLAEARVNKIIKMIRLLGNCSGKAVILTYPVFLRRFTTLSVNPLLLLDGVLTMVIRRTI